MIAGVSRDALQPRLRDFLAEVTGFHVHDVVDVDHYDKTTAVTLVASEATAFRSALGVGHAASVLRLLPNEDPWSPALLGIARRRELSGARAAEVSAAF